MFALIFFQKIHQRYPSGWNRSEIFCSGHTAQAFATATFMAKEYGEQVSGMLSVPTGWRQPLEPCEF